MHLNYLTLKRQVAAIAPRIQDGIISCCFSQIKNELIIEIEKEEQPPVFLHYGSDNQYPFLVLSEQSRHKKNSTVVFRELNNLRVAALTLLPRDRIIRLQFQNSPEKIYIQLFTSHSNLFLVDSENKILNCFKKRSQLGGTIYKLPAAAEKEEMATLTNLYQSLGENKDLSAGQFLKTHFPFMTRTVIREIAFRTGMEPEKNISRFKKSEIEKIQETIEDFLNQCETAAPVIYWQGPIPLKFSLGPLHHLNNADQKTYSDINTALRTFCFQSIKFRGISAEMRRFKKIIRDRLQFVQKSLENISRERYDPSDRLFYQKTGQLLLTQPKNVRFSGNSVQVIDYFDPNLKEITVKVDPKLNLQENAEKYFIKARKVEEKQKEQVRRRRMFLSEAEQLKKLQKTLEDANSFKEMEKIRESLRGMGLISGQKEKQRVRRPFKSFPFQDFEIRVGRTSRDNDELTFKWAHKEDLWLHVQSHSGSHVVIHDPHRRPSVPPSVLQYAGSLAVTFSSAKHTSYVPVIYTQVKYVRKPHKSPPGTVIPSRVKTIYCDPVKS